MNTDFASIRVHPRPIFSSGMAKIVIYPLTNLTERNELHKLAFTYVNLVFPTEQLISNNSSGYCGLMAVGFAPCSALTKLRPQCTS